MPAHDKLEYAFVAVTGIVLFLAGTAYLIAPQILLDPIGIGAGAEGMVDLRATYASGQVAAALYLTWLISKATRRPLALPLVFVLLSTVTLARGYALVAEQVYSGVMLNALIVEAISALLALGLLLTRKSSQ